MNQHGKDLLVGGAVGGAIGYLLAEQSPSKSQQIENAILQNRLNNMSVQEQMWELKQARDEETHGFFAVLIFLYIVGCFIFPWMLIGIPILCYGLYQLFVGIRDTAREIKLFLTNTKHRKNVLSSILKGIFLILRLMIVVVIGSFLILYICGVLLPLDDIHHGSIMLSVILTMSYGVVVWLLFSKFKLTVTAILVLVICVGLLYSAKKTAADNIHFMNKQEIQNWQDNFDKEHLRHDLTPVYHQQSNEAE